MKNHTCWWIRYRCWYLPFIIRIEQTSLLQLHIHTFLSTLFVPISWLFFVIFRSYFSILIKILITRLFPQHVFVYQPQIQRDHILYVEGKSTLLYEELTHSFVLCTFTYIVCGNRKYRYKLLGPIWMNIPVFLLWKEWKGIFSLFYQKIQFPFHCQNKCLKINLFL